MRSISVDLYFKGLMLFLIALFLLLLFVDPLGTQLNVFFAKTGDFFADFFNVMIYISDDDPYFNTLNGTEQKPYFPLAYLIMSIFSGFEDFSKMTSHDSYSSTTAMISCLLFTLGSIALFFHSLNKIVKLNTIIIVILSLSSIFLFTIERGNLVMISASLLFYFLAYKNSSSNVKRTLSLISFCSSVVLKGFPVVFGLYLLKERRYKDIIFCIVLTTILTFLPYLCFEHGFGNIQQHIQNVSLNSLIAEKLTLPRYGLTFIPNFLINHVSPITYSFLFGAARYLIWILSAVSICLFFYDSISWKIIAMLSFVIGYLPSVNWFYLGIFFMPAILLFLHQNEGRKLDYVYASLFCIFLNPLQFEINNIPVSWMLSDLSILAAWIFLIYDVGVKAWLVKGGDKYE